MRLRATLRGFATVLVVSAAVSCGGDDRDLPDPGPASSVDRATALVTLPVADVQTLCAWVAGRFGGDNRRVMCSDGTYLSSAPSQTACLQSLQGGDPNCPATVGDLEDCINGVIGGCSALPLACFAVLSCGGG